MASCLQEIVLYMFYIFLPFLAIVNMHPNRDDLRSPEPQTPGGTPQQLATFGDDWRSLAKIGDDWQLLARVWPPFQPK
jgi:hypothetical protein